MSDTQSAKSDVASELICVGIVTTAHGIRGEFRVKPLTENPEDIASYGPVLDAQGRELLTLRIRSISSKGALVVAKEVRDRNAAEALRGQRLHVHKASLPDVEEEDSWYYHELEGLAVHTESGGVIGVVHAIADHGAGDILEIRCTDGRMLSLPFIESFFPVVDSQAGVITVRLPGNIDELLQ